MMTRMQDGTDEATGDLVSLLNQKDPAAGPTLERQHREALIRFCAGYLGRLEEAEDATQEILLKVLQAPAVPDHFRAWMYKIARNHCLQCMRKRAWHEGVVSRPSQIPEALTGQLTRLVNAEAQDRLRQAFQLLSDEQREALRLRYVENLSRSEIADILEVPDSAVKSRLFEGLKRLRDEAARLETR